VIASLSPVAIISVWIPKQLVKEVFFDQKVSNLVVKSANLIAGFLKIVTI
jgi:hypothetical protein